VRSVDTPPGRPWRQTFQAGVALLALALGACAPTKPPAPPPPAPVPPPPVPAPAPAPALKVKDWAEFKKVAALQIMKANPEHVYHGPVPEPLKGIPILDIELAADGRVLNIEVQRRPRPADAQHTTQLAIDAVKRAGPFPMVRHLPKPWKFSEVFLFNDQDQFKPRTLDE